MRMQFTCFGAICIAEDLSFGVAFSKRLSLTPVVQVSYPAKLRGFSVTGIAAHLQSSFAFSVLSNRTS